MNKSELEKEVAGHPFLLGLNEHHIRLLADCALHTHIPPTHACPAAQSPLRAFSFVEIAGEEDLDEHLDLATLQQGARP